MVKIVNRIIVKIVLAMIILIMVITAIGNYRGFYPKNDYIISVNGQKISRLQFEQSLNFASQLLGQELTKIITSENAMQQFRAWILQNVIDEVLLQQYVKKIGIDINDEEIKKVIFNQPDFQVDSKFDNVKYRNVLKIMGITSNQYAEALRKQLAVQKLLSTLVKTDFLLPNEKNILAKLLLQKRLVRKSVIDINSISIVKKPVKEDDIKNFYKNHSNYFILPEQFRVSYLPLDANKISKPYVSNFEINQWYELHKLDYLELPQYKFKIIQVKTEKEAKFLLNELKNGADFSKIAQTKSIDPISARRGGQIGWIRTEDMPDELKKVHLQQPGQLSDIIKCSIGYLIVRLEDIHPKHIRPLNEVRPIIINKIQQQKIFNKYFSVQKKMMEFTSNSISINQLEHLTGMKTEESDWFNIKTIPNNLNFPAFIRAIFNSRQNHTNTFYIPVDSHSCFWVRITQHRPAHLESLSSVHNIIATYLQRQKTNKQVKEELEKILLLLNKGKSEVDLRLKFGDMIIITRNNTDSITNKVFNMNAPKKNQSTYALSQDAQGNFVVIALDKIWYKDASKKQLIAISSNMIRNQINMSIAALLNELRKNSIIKYGSN
ncbi:MAG: peptidylprolyl isomerase [Candidatus Dasytiphilus stammeri]